MLKGDDKSKQTIGTGGEGGGGNFMNSYCSKAFITFYVRVRRYSERCSSNVSVITLSAIFGSFFFFVGWVGFGL